MLLSGYIVFGVLFLLLLITVYNVLTAPQLRSAPPVIKYGRISVLVPARNEAKKIAECLRGLLAQDYPDYEVIVLDDQSEDGTAGVVQQFLGNHANLRLISGKPLPGGWLGKNWACHQLSQAASGDILIFADADTRHKPGAIRATAGWMQQQKLGLFTAFLEQETRSWAEKLVVPLVYAMVYTTLPLWLTRFSNFKSTVAANGQWMAFSRQAYERLGGHKAVKNQVVEDMQLARRAKILGIPQLTGSAAGVIHCRMYHSAESVVNGYAKNLFGIVNYKISGLTLLLGLNLITGVVPFILILFPETIIPGLASLGILLLIRLLVAWRFGLSDMWSIILHPFGVLLVCSIAFASYLYHHRGDIYWKGRNVGHSTVSS